MLLHYFIFLYCHNNACFHLVAILQLVITEDVGRLGDRVESREKPLIQLVQTTEVSFRRKQLAVKIIYLNMLLSFSGEDHACSTSVHVLTFSR